MALIQSSIAHVSSSGTSKSPRKSLTVAKVLGSMPVQPLVNLVLQFATVSLTYWNCRSTICVELSVVIDVVESLVWWFTSCQENR
jgi:hypothetical protein